MMKKIFLILVLIFSFSINSFATYNPESNIVNDTEKQEYLKGKTIDYDAVRTKLNDNSITNEMIDTNIKDGLEGDITRAAYDSVIDQEETTGTENMACSYDGEGDIISAMQGCVSGVGANGKKLSLVGVNNNGNLKVDDGLKTQIIEWTQKIAGFLGLGAIFAIAFGSLRMILSRGEEEQIKKGKDIVKWGILGFLAVVSAGFIVGIVVNVMYGVLG